jgi:DNA-binding NarL/FixJ family response regulator
MVSPIRRKMFRTLVVEDNAAFRKTLSGMLERHFSTLVLENAASSEEALLKMSRFSPDLVFIDIHLPGRNGLQLSRILKARNEKTVIVILTNSDGLEYRQAAIHCGADYFLSKSEASVDEIIEVVETVMSGFGAHHSGGIARQSQFAS